nr:MAG TPA: hypothetical protein [Caudoviricetes sp.]
MKGYKGFRKGLICKGKQYAENTVFEEEAVICKNGMHFYKNPFDVLDYYGFVDENGHMNEFAEVEALAETDTNDDKKYCTTKLKVGAKLSFAGFVKACVDFVLEKTTLEMGDDDENKIGSSGDYAQIGSSGDYAQIGSSGDYAHIGSSGYYAQIGSSGYYAQIGSSGYSAKIGSSGDSAQICSTGEDSVICCAGHNSAVKAKKGSWITLSEWKYSEEKNRMVPLCVKTEYVDGERIKADTFYHLVKGEFKEVN